MKICIIGGSHPRHRFLVEKLFSLSRDVHVICAERESLLRENENIRDHRLSKLMKIHFDDRFNIEQTVFGDEDLSVFCKKNQINFYGVTKDNFNSTDTKKFFRNTRADICVVAGSYILDNEFLSLLPEKSVNIHLGLSPWYRGSATLFWPTYNLEPWNTGVTLHKMTELPDGGGIYAQSGSILNPEYGVHETATEAIKLGSELLFELVSEFRSGKNIEVTPQRLVGRSYLFSQFRPEHLIAIYEKFDNRVVKYLTSVYEKLPEPKLINNL